MGPRSSALRTTWCSLHRPDHVTLSSHLEFAPSVELLELPLGGVHVGEPGGFAQNPGVLQGLPDTEPLLRVQDNQLTDLKTDKEGQDRVYTPYRTKSKWS